MMQVSVPRVVASCLVVAVLACAVWAFAAPAAAPAKGNPADGKKIFTTKCVTCHKADGTGGVKLTGNPSPNWKDKKHQALMTDAYLRDCITNGKVKSGMVAWGKTGQVKPADIDNLIAYIRVLSGTK